MKLLHQYEKIDKQLIIFLELGPGKNGDLWYFSIVKLKGGAVLLTTDYKIYIVGGPVVNLKLKWGDVLLATDYKIYIVGGLGVNLYFEIIWVHYLNLGGSKSLTALIFMQNCMKKGTFFNFFIKNRKVGPA